MSNTVKKPGRTSPDSYSPQKPEILRMAEQTLKETNYPEVFLLTDKHTMIPPKVSHNCPGYVYFANEYSYFMDYSGQGYGFISGDDGWRCDINYTLADIITGHALRPGCLDVSPEGLDRLWKTTGFLARQTYYANSAKGEYMSEQDMKEAIKYTLCALGQPVILPIASRWCGSVVVGYKENGNVLVTYGYPPYFMAPDNTQPRIEEINNWYQDSTQLTVVGKRQETPSVRELYQEGLRQVHTYLEANIRGEDGHYFEEWEAFLRLSMDEMITEVERTQVVPGFVRQDDMQGKSIRDSIDLVADPTWCDMAERRYYVMHFFRQAAQYFPEEKAAMQEIENHFGWSNGIIGDMYIKEVGHDPVDAKAFENQEVRARMADCVRQFRDADAKGLEMVEKLLVRMGT